MMNRQKRWPMLVILALALWLPSCTTWYNSIDRAEDGRYIMTRNQVPFIGPKKAQVWIGTYDPSTKTMTIVEKHELGPS